MFSFANRLNPSFEELVTTWAFLPEARNGLTQLAHMRFELRK